VKKIFVYQDWPSLAEVQWTDRFAAALRDKGYEVFQEWTQPKPPPTEATERALRESDAIVFLLLHASSLSSPAFYFNVGVAEFEEKAAVAVVGRSIEPAQIPLAELKRHAIPKSTPRSTASKIAAQLRVLAEHSAA
jgi:hypothetical protein